MTEKDKKGQGGGLAEEGEFIDVVEMGVEEVRRLETFYDWIFISRWRAIYDRRELLALLDFFSPSNGSSWTSFPHKDELTSSWEELIFSSLHFLFDLITNTSLSTNISSLSSAIWSLILINYQRNFPSRSPSKHQYFQFRYFQVFFIQFHQNHMFSHAQKTAIIADRDFGKFPYSWNPLSRCEMFCTII